MVISFRLFNEATPFRFLPVVPNLSLVRLAIPLSASWSFHGVPKGAMLQTMVLPERSPRLVVMNPRHRGRDGKAGR